MMNRFLKTARFDMHSKPLFTREELEQWLQQNPSRLTAFRLSREHVSDPNFIGPLGPCFEGAIWWDEEGAKYTVTISGSLLYGLDR